jgi:hypothetical protein
MAKKSVKKAETSNADSAVPVSRTAAATEAAAKVCAIFPEVEEFEKLANDYFDECDAEYRLYGEAGLALYLSEHNLAQRFVSVNALRGWHDGVSCPHLQDAVGRAYTRIQAQIESDPRYQVKGMVTARIFLQKQKRLGEYQDKTETKNDTTFRFTFGDSMDKSDFE